MAQDMLSYLVMETTTNNRPRDWAEGRRLRAWELAQLGWKQKDIAAALGVSEGAVSQWLKRARQDGRDALLTHPHPGRLPKLSDEQRRQLPDLVARGAEAFGFLGDVWTTKRIAFVIKQTFGISYHPAHVSRLLRQLGLSVQIPEVQATQRDEAAIQAWYDQRWPSLKKRLPTSSEQLSS